jgi:3-hydroxyisobutyrate dehydrogenase-like beta-hydroxyacid dehydrogenase
MNCMSSSPDAVPVGVIGLGAMGWGLATRLAATANLAAVYDQSPDVGRKALAADLPFVSSIPELALSCRIVLCMLPTPQAFLDVVTSQNGLAGHLTPDSTIIDMATDGPDVVIEARDALARRGIRVVDAAVGRGPAEAASGKLIIMAGGERDHVESLRWLYEKLGSEVHYCGPLGTGQSAKLVNNLVQCANAAILSEACDLARATGVSDAVIRAILPRTAAASQQLDNIVLRRVPARDFAPGFKVELAAKDVRLAVSAGDSRNVPMDCSREVLRLYERHIAAGNGSMDQAIIVMGLPRNSEVEEHVHG